MLRTVFCVLFYAAVSHGNHGHLTPDQKLAHYEELYRYQMIGDAYCGKYDEDLAKRFFGCFNQFEDSCGKKLEECESRILELEMRYNWKCDINHYAISRNKSDTIRRCFRKARYENGTSCLFHRYHYRGDDAVMTCQENVLNIPEEKKIAVKKLAKQQVELYDSPKMKKFCNNTSFNETRDDGLTEGKVREILQCSWKDHKLYQKCASELSKNLTKLNPPQELTTIDKWESSCFWFTHRIKYFNSHDYRMISCLYREKRKEIKHVHSFEEEKKHIQEKIQFNDCLDDWFRSLDSSL